MKGILFDMDGVLIDAMPYHAEAFQIAFRKEANISIDKKEVFLLEGMPGPDLVKEILRNHNKTADNKLVENISKLKKEIFKEKQKAKAFEGVKELIQSLDCLKAVVSGASKQEVESLLHQNDLSGFDTVITGEDLEEGKPDPEPFQTALHKLNLSSSEAIIVENAPLGVESAIKAGVRYIITLNNTPLEISDFKSILKDYNNGEIKDRIFKDTKSASKLLTEWCCEKDPMKT
jgi:beta-phosphoglucomutase